MAGSGWSRGWPAANAPAMARFGIASQWVRTPFGALLALLLAVRLLSPVGFMPSFEHGALTIVSCPDFAPSAASPMGHHSHGDRGKGSQPCPYAAASGPAALTLVEIFAAAILLLAAMILRGGASEFFRDRRHHPRPPSRAPPFPA